MYTSFEVEHFRCFDHLTLPRLSRINLIGGLNNVGKTSLMEAIFLHCGAYNPVLTGILNAVRGMEIQVGLEKGFSPWDSYFHNFDTLTPVRLVGHDTLTGRRSLTLIPTQSESLNLNPPFTGSGDLTSQSSQTADRAASSLRQTAKALDVFQFPKVLELEYDQLGKRGKIKWIIDAKGIRVEPVPLPPPFPAFLVSDRAVNFPDTAELFGKLEVEKKEGFLLHALQLIEPKLRRLAMVVLGTTPTLHGDIGKERLMPLPLMGGGMARSMNLIVRLCNASQGVILVDEIENGIHHSVMKQLWTTIGDLARAFDVQVFATTHSLECITAAHEAFRTLDIDDFTLHRLERTKRGFEAISYDRNTLAAAIEAGLETR